MSREGAMSEGARSKAHFGVLDYGGSNESSWVSCLRWLLNSEN